MRVQNEVQNDQLREEGSKVKTPFKNKIKKVFNKSKHAVANWVDNLGTIKCRILVIESTKRYKIVERRYECTQEEVEAQLELNEKLITYGKKWIMTEFNNDLMSIVDLADELGIEVVDVEEIN